MGQLYTYNGSTWDAVVGAQGIPGSNGRQVELQKTATYVQWRYVGDVAWTNLVALSDITGPAGPAGSGSGDMLKSTYDAANIVQQVVGTTATQTLSNKTLTAPILSSAAITGTNGTLNVSSVTDGGDFNIYHAETGTKTLAIYGSGANTMNLNLLDGSLQTASVTRLDNAGNLSNTTFDTATTGNSLKINGTAVTAVTGTGSNVLSTSPSLTTPTIGSAGANFSGSTSGTTAVKAAATASGTLTFPAATDTLVGKATTDTLTNKTLTTTSTTFADATDATKKLQFQASAQTTGTTNLISFPNATSMTVVSTAATQTLTNKTLTTPVISSISNTGTITLPTSTDTLVGRATTDTLTNKTIDATTNTVSNVASLSVKRQNDTTNTTVTGTRIETGSGVIAGSATKAVTFNTAFTSVPIVIVTNVGGNGSSAAFAYPSVGGSGGQFTDRVIAAVGQTTGGFTAYASGTAPGAAQGITFTWMAIGN